MLSRRYSGLAVVLLIALLVSARKPTVDMTPPPAASKAIDVALKRRVGDGRRWRHRQLHAAIEHGTARLVDSVLRADSIAKVEQRGLHARRQRLFVRHDRAVQRMLHTLVGRSEKGNHQEPASGSRQPRVSNTRTPIRTTSTSGCRPASGPWLLQLRRRRLARGGGQQRDRRERELHRFHATGADGLGGEDLKAHKKLCTVAYWHHPRFSSGWHGSDRRFIPIWQSRMTTTSISCSRP